MKKDTVYITRTFSCTEKMDYFVVDKVSLSFHVVCHIMILYVLY